MTALRKLANNFSETEIDGEFVVMLVESGEFLSMEGTAGSIWMLIDGRRNRDDIVAELAAQYTAPDDEIVEDVDQFLDTLRSAGLIAID